MPSGPGPGSAARVAALRVYEAVERGAATLPDSLALAQAGLADSRDRALAAEIVTGTFRWRAALDHALATHAARPLDRLDDVILGILRLSAYQLLFLDRVPARAVVFDAVALTRDAKKTSAAGFVNAVLRRVASADRATIWPAADVAGRDEAGRLEYLSTTLSHPRWLVERWLTRYGWEATEAWARFDNAPAPLTLRVNDERREALREHLATQGIETEAATFSPYGLIVRSGQPLHGPLARQGLFIVQDEASQLVGCVAQAAMPPRSVRVLDACAAPGGKTIALVSALGDRGVVVATDRRRRRIRLLRDTIAAAGADRVRVAQLDLEAGLPFSDVFDLLLVDAPCSGLGTLRREPEIRWRRSPEDLPRLAARQRHMLVHAATGVRPGGRLVYATCSSEPEENEEVAAAFLAAHAGFRAVAADSLPLSASVRPVIDGQGHLRTLPHAHGLEAFFAAVFERVS